RGSRDPRRPPLLSAADAEAGCGRDQPRELLRLHHPGRDRPPRGRSAQGQEGVRLVATGEFDQLYRELILDHYKNPRNHGLLEAADASAEEVAAMPKQELLDELGIPLTPVRLKCAILGLGVLKLALHKARGTPLPDEWGTAARDLVLE